jgi:hypothetical protein
MAFFFLFSHFSEVLFSINVKSKDDYAILKGEGK